MVAEGSTWKTPSGEILRLREVGPHTGRTARWKGPNRVCIPSHLILDVLQVWQDNLEEELELIRDIVDDYPYLAMGEMFADTPPNVHLCTSLLLCPYPHSAKISHQQGMTVCEHGSFPCRHRISRHSGEAGRQLQERGVPLPNAQVSCD